MNRYESYKDSGIKWLDQVPAHWHLTRLKNLGIFVGGGTPSKDNPEYWNGDIPWVSPKDMKREIIDSTEDYITVFALRDSATQMVPPGSMLLVVRSGILKHSIPVAINEVPVTINQDMKAFLPNGRIHARYVADFIKGRSRDLLVEWRKLGATVESLEYDLIIDTPFLVPPLDDQQAITRYLDKETARIDHLIANKRQQIKKLDELRQVTISNAVTRGLDPTVPMKDSGIDWLGVIPSHWELKRLKQVAQVRGGVAKGRDLGSRDTLSLPYIRVANVQDGYLNLEDVANIVIAHDEIERYSLESGDVLMNEGGDFDKLGRGFIWHGQVNPCLHQNHVFAVRPFARMESEWLDLVTSSSYAKHYFILKSRQSTNLASISSTNLKGLPIVLPEKGERDKIVEYVRDKSRKFQRATQNMESQLKKLYELRKITINDAVTGKVKVTD